MDVGFDGGWEALWGHRSTAGLPWVADPTEKGKGLSMSRLRLRLLRGIQRSVCRLTHWERENRRGPRKHLTESPLTEREVETDGCPKS